MTAPRTLLIGTAGLVAIFLLTANLMIATGLLALASFAAIRERSSMRIIMSSAAAHHDAQCTSKLGRPVST
jgi:hypothetical protein